MTGETANVVPPRPDAGGPGQPQPVGRRPVEKRFDPLRPTVGRPDSSRPIGGRVVPAGSRGIDEILTAARARLLRLTPEAAHLACRAGAVLVDIRPAGQRAATGAVPGALAVERNVLEWRFDPRCAARLPIAGYDLPVIVLCQEGFTSSLAAAALLDLGVHRATDVRGGFVAWRMAGLPAFRPAGIHQGATTPMALPETIPGRGGTG